LDKYLLKGVIMKNYQDTADELTNRILALIPNHKEILEMVEVFDLFKIKEFECSDLQPSISQAQWALTKAKLMYV